MKNEMSREGAFFKKLPPQDGRSQWSQGEILLVWWISFQVFIGCEDKAGSAKAEKDQIQLTRIGDSLPTARRDEHYVTGIHITGGQAADLHAAFSF
jgi:hypothetical protein